MLNNLENLASEEIIQLISSDCNKNMTRDCDILVLVGETSPANGSIVVLFANP
ncbi:unnamed protein product [Nezara viridula]|uniref:Uncharacterized protein n=1 Tax=Nezara viridula TaxID=85310 RepID=A0A9P0H5P5_NEZVI|nr:unnamed protein product [Nezara viridula]